MPAYELEIATVLIVAAGVSGIVLYTSLTSEGSIKLPVSSENGGEGSLEGEAEPDPFDVTKPDDFIDGQPINEDAFWSKMRARKLLILAVLALLIISLTVTLGYSIISSDPPRFIAVSALKVVYALYIFALSAWSLTLSEVYTHWRTTVHLSALTTLAFLTLFISTIVPSEDPSPVLLKALRITSIILYLVAAFLTARTPRGPALHYPPSLIYSDKVIASTTSFAEDNVCGIANASVWDVLLFSYTTKLVLLGYTATSLEIGDLPIVPANMRATTLYARMRAATKNIKFRGKGRWTPKYGSGWELCYRLLKLNAQPFILEICLAAVSAMLFYAPAYFLQNLVRYLEQDPNRENPGWGWFFCAGLFFITASNHLVVGQLWSLSTTTLQVRLRVQLNSILFAKTLIRKDVASSAAATQPKTDGALPGTTPVTGAPAPSTSASTVAPSPIQDDNKEKEKDKEEDEFSSKAQIMTLMTTDVDRVSEFSWHFFALVDSPIEIVIGTFFLYKLLGVSCFVGLAVTCLFLPMNHFASKVVVVAQDNLMKARDERVALMNEVLGAIRMLKFMAWERSFEARILKIREKELKYQRLNYIIEVAFNFIWSASPIFVTLAAFWHFAVFRNQTLTPSIAFTSIAVFTEMKFALNALPEVFINVLQSLVSLRRLEKYLGGVEVNHVPGLDGSERPIAFQSATISWPLAKNTASLMPSAAPSAAPTPRRKFQLIDLTASFPSGDLSLICGKLGSGKTLMLLSLLGEADLLAGQISCPRSPPNTLASFVGVVPSPDKWVVPGVCAYVPQSAWLQNASIRDNILFNLPYVKERYEKTLQVCALVSDLKILEDGDDSEIGERGVNLSGGQKARVSLARAVYSRASVLLLDDVLSAVDAHTAHILYHDCLKGDLMKGRTVVLVSHHIQLCLDGAAYVVALDNGRIAFAGDRDQFRASDVMSTLVQSSSAEGMKPEEEARDEEQAAKEEALIEDSDFKNKSSASSITQAEDTDPISETSSTMAATSVDADSKALEKKKPRKLIEEEKRATGRISKDIWLTYISAVGNWPYWLLFVLVALLATLSPVLENGWLRVWSAVSQNPEVHKGPAYYVGIYAIVTAFGLTIGTLRWFVLYEGSIHASTILYKRLLEAVLFAHIRFHDTISRGRLLNRFGKDFEGIDSKLSDNFGRSIFYAMAATTSLTTISIVGGLPFLGAAVIIGILYWNVGSVYGQCSRDMRRLDSVTRSPLYSIYGETIAGVTILRAFGASSKFMRDMLQCVDTNTNPYYWMWGVNRWLSARFNLLSAAVLGVTGLVALLTPSIDASLAGFALAFASSITGDLLFLVRRFVGLEQSMVALERIKEFSDLPREPPEFIEPRPAPDWPSDGSVVCENLVIRYSPELPVVLHNLNFEVFPGEKIGILGRTGSGKSTLALSFFRFVEASEGRILVDGVDIAKIGLTDLRSKLTIIPQDPTILSGTLRSTLDVFDEYQDYELYEALRRVHLIPSEGVEGDDLVNTNVFRNLDSSVSEGGENFSTGEKQLLCMARAILKRSKVLVMDEATASVDYATDELISKTIRHEFANSTILTIAHRLRTVIDYNRIMLLEDGRIVEFDRPATLLSNTSSKFYSLCKATGKQEFAMLRHLAGV